MITLLCHEQEFRGDCHRHVLADVLIGREREYDSHYDMTVAEILSYIPKQRKLTLQSQLEGELNAITAKFPSNCYYCKRGNFGDKATFEKHIILNHPGKLCYPSKIDLVNFNIKGQGMPWEI